MALRQNTAEGGTNGTAITASSQTGGASGTQFNLIASTSATSFSNAHPAHGSMGYFISHDTNTSRSFVWSGYTATQMALRCYRYFPALPSATSSLMGVFIGAGTTPAQLYLQSDGRVLLQDAGGTIYTSTVALATDTQYRFEMAVEVGTTTSNGTINMAVYEADSTAELFTFSSTTANTGTTALANVQFGRPINSAATYGDYLDDIAANDGTLTFIGPVVIANQAPTANAGIDQTDLEPYSTVTLSGTDNDSDGTVVTRTWTQVSGSPTVTLSGSGATRTYVAPGTINGTTLVFGYQVVDDDGEPSTQDTVNHEILPVTERAVIGGAEVPVQTLVAQDGGLE